MQTVKVAMLLSGSVSTQRNVLELLGEKTVCQLSNHRLSAPDCKLDHNPINQLADAGGLPLSGCLFVHGWQFYKHTQLLLGHAADHHVCLPARFERLAPHCWVSWLQSLW